MGLACADVVGCSASARRLTMEHIADGHRPVKDAKFGGKTASSALLEPSGPRALFLGRCRSAKVQLSNRDHRIKGRILGGA